MRLPSLRYPDGAAHAGGWRRHVLQTCGGSLHGLFPATPQLLSEPTPRVVAPRQEIFSPRRRRGGFGGGGHAFEKPVDQARAASRVELLAQARAIRVMLAAAVRAEPQARAVVEGLGAAAGGVDFRHDLAGDTRFVVVGAERRQR